MCSSTCCRLSDELNSNLLWCCISPACHFLKPSGSRGLIQAQSLRHTAQTPHWPSELCTLKHSSLWQWRWRRWPTNSDYKDLCWQARQRAILHISLSWQQSDSFELHSILSASWRLGWFVVTVELANFDIVSFSYGETLQVNRVTFWIIKKKKEIWITLDKRRFKISLFYKTW